MFLDIHGWTVHLQSEGPATAAGGRPAVVLLHSLGTSLHVWDPQVPVLARRFQVIRPDLRGHGLSEVTPGPYTIEGLAGDVLALLGRLGVSRAHVVGLSIGGLIAQAMALAAPERVASLTLCDTALVIPPPANWHERARLVREKGMTAIVETVLARWVSAAHRSAPEGRGLRQMLLRTDPEGYAAAAEAIAAADFTAKTPTLSLPAHVIVGGRDESTPPTAAEALAAALKARLSLIPGAAHIPNFEHANAFSDAISGFLESLGETP